MKRYVVVTAVLEVHPRHSTGRLKDELREKLEDFTPVKHLSVEDLDLLPNTGGG